MAEALQIGVLGDYDSNSPTLPAIAESIHHASIALHEDVQATWLSTPSLLNPELNSNLQAFDGLWAAPGSPYKSFDGMLRGIEFARRHDWPFLGTCGGFQYTLIECARNVLGVKDADSAENKSGSQNIVIYPVACAVPNRAGNAPKLSGVVPEIHIRRGSRLHSFYDEEIVAEEFFCNFEVNPEFERLMTKTGYIVVATGEKGEVRAIESPFHQFFFATLFQPQLSSKPGKPHPIIVQFIRAAAKWKTKKAARNIGIE